MDPQPNQILWTRTGYLLEYIAKGMRKPRRDVVVEVVPIEVGVVDAMKPAVIDEFENGILWVYDGLLYERVGFVDQQNETAKDHKASLTFDYMRPELLRRGATTPSINQAEFREDLAIRQVVTEGHAEGIAWANQNAERLRIWGNTIMRQPDGVPSKLMKIYESGVATKNFANVDRDFLFDDSARIFKHHDVANMQAFKDRHINGRGKRWGDGDTYQTRNWTPEGLEAEDMTAWWVIWRAHDLCKQPFAYAQFGASGAKGFGHAMTADIDILEALIDIRKFLAPHRYRVPAAQHARTLAQEALIRLGALAGDLQYDSSSLTGVLVNSIRSLQTEVDTYPMKANLEPDLDVLIELDTEKQALGF